MFESSGLRSEARRRADRADSNAAFGSLKGPTAEKEFWHPTVARRAESGLLWKAFGIALALHVGALLLSFPEFRKEVVPQRQHKYVVVRKYVPPPPKIERRREVQRREFTRRLPIPDPTPEEPEPIREPEPVFEAAPPDDVEYLLGVPEAPPAVMETGPLIAGAGNVTNPVRIEDSYVKPIYPDLARIARIQGTVVLQAVVRSDGTVSEVRVLRCSDPGFGFEEEARKAVGQWLYEPATQDGRPVDVFFSVIVEFELK